MRGKIFNKLQNASMECIYVLLILLFINFISILVEDAKEHKNLETKAHERVSF